MQGFAILLLIVAFLCFVWPYIARWLKRKAMERTEDYIRQAMGFPPREKQGKRRKQQEKADEDDNYYYTRQHARRYNRYSGPLIPPEYAEDIEFTEYIDFSGTEYIQRISRHIEFHIESQISDAEWTEIKKSRTK